MTKYETAFFSLLLYVPIICAQDTAQFPAPDSTSFFPLLPGSFWVYAEYQSGEKTDAGMQKDSVETDSITAIIEGKFVGLNTDGDFSLLLLENSNGDIVSFIFTADSILVNEPQYEGKTLRVTYKTETFEEAGSGEKFEGNYIISVQVTD